jgi:hypothetical protein
VDSADFLPLLKRLDDCIAYVAANPQYADAATYAVKFRQLQARALTAVRTKVQIVLRGAAAQVQAAAREAGAQGAGQPPPAPLQLSAGAVADGASAALLYVKFRAAAEPALKDLLQGIEQRAQQSQASWCWEAGARCLACVLYAVLCMVWCGATLAAGVSAFLTKHLVRWLRCCLIHFPVQVFVVRCACCR